MGFDPACLLMSLTTVTAVDTLKEDSEANGFQIGMAAGTDQFSICCVDEHGTTTPEAFSVASDALINLDTSTSGTRSNVIDATVAFITGGTTHDYSVVDGSALQGWSLSLEALVNSLPTYRPPCIHLSEVESRALDFHHHQIFDVITGSGEVLDSGTYLNVLQCVGSGPLYDVWLSSTCPPSNSGVDGVQVGDFLIIGEDDDHVYSTPDISWYKYHIEGILTEATSQSGEFRVRYVKDTKELGDDDPCDLYATYSNGGGYGDNPDKKVSMVVRRVNVDFLLGN